MVDERIKQRGKPGTGRHIKEYSPNNAKRVSDGVEEADQKETGRKRGGRRLVGRLGGNPADVKMRTGMGFQGEIAWGTLHLRRRFPGRGRIRSTRIKSVRPRNKVQAIQETKGIQDVRVLLHRRRRGRCPLSNKRCKKPALNAKDMGIICILQGTAPQVAGTKDAMMLSRSMERRSSNDSGEPGRRRDKRRRKKGKNQPMGTEQHWQPQVGQSRKDHAKNQPRETEQRRQPQATP